MIDAHVHLWTDNNAVYPRSFPGEEFSPHSFTAEDYFGHSRASGVSRAVLVQMSFYGCDNRYMLDCMRAYPGVFSGIAIVDSNVRDPSQSMRDLATEGVRGFRIHPQTSQGAWLDTPGMQAMWKCAAEQRLAICPLINPSDLADLDRMCASHPEVTVVIDHMARIGAARPVTDDDARALCRFAAHQNVYVKLSAFYALGLKHAPYEDLLPLVRRVFESFGPARLMWGSDCPFQLQGGHTYSDSLDFVRERLAFTGPDDREWLLGRTAERIFFERSRGNALGALVSEQEPI